VNPSGVDRSTSPASLSFWRWLQLVVDPSGADRVCSGCLDLHPDVPSTGSGSLRNKSQTRVTQVSIDIDPSTGIGSLRSRSRVPQARCPLPLRASTGRGSLRSRSPAHRVSGGLRHRASTDSSRLSSAPAPLFARLASTGSGSIRSRSPRAGGRERAVARDASTGSGPSGAGRPRSSRTRRRPCTFNW